MRTDKYTRRDWPADNEEDVVRWLFIDRSEDRAIGDCLTYTSIRLWGERREGGFVVFVLCSNEHRKPKIERIIQDAEDMYGVEE